MITRLKPLGWSTNQTLLSSEISAVDQNIENALDKRSGQTDTLGSDLTVSGTMDVTGTGNRIVLSAAGKIVADANGSQILANAAGSKIITANGAIFEVGGNTEFPVFTTSRSRSKVFLSPLTANSGWEYSVGTYLTATVGGGPCVIEIPVHDGATLVSVEMFYQIATSHFPASKLNMSIERYDITSGAQYNLSSSFIQYVPGTDAASYYQSGGISQYTYTCDQNNIIDSSTYRYLLFFEEESGAGSTPGNRIHGFRANFTTINDMRFA